MEPLAAGRASLEKSFDATDSHFLATEPAIRHADRGGVIGVVPTYPRHPVALAQQALTAAAACGGRFALGIGLSHPPVTEGMLGL